jgi:hypothetical protein
VIVSAGRDYVLAIRARLQAERSATPVLDGVLVDARGIAAASTLPRRANSARNRPIASRVRTCRFDTISAAITPFARARSTVPSRACLVRANTTFARAIDCDLPRL